MLFYIQKITILTIFLFSITSCSDWNKKAKKDMDSPFLFYDGFSSSGISLFSLLDPYPSLKDGMKKLDAKNFNVKLNQSMQDMDRTAIIGSMRGLRSLMLENDATLRSTLQTTATLLNRIRTRNPAAYQTTIAYIDKLRKTPEPVLEALIPISNQMLRAELYGYPCDPCNPNDKTAYTGKNSEEIQKLITDLATTLEKQDSKDLLKTINGVIYKMSHSNASAKNGFKELLQGLLHPSIINDKKLKDHIVSLLSVAGEAMNQKSGFSNTKSAESTVKELILNLENYYTVGGSVYDANQGIYNASGHSAELKQTLTDAFLQVRKMVIADAALQKDPSKSILEGLLDNLQTFTTANPELLDSSLKQLTALDLRGYDRAKENATASEISALESLMFVLALTDIYGYTWNDSTTLPQINGSTSGAMTLGDSMLALRSKIDSANDSAAGIGMLQFMNSSKTASNAGTGVYKDGAIFAIDINTRALCLLQGESRGEISNCNDPLYTKTIPWAMSMIARVVFDGYGPYYNKNKYSSSTNYKSSWATSAYKIQIKDGSYVGLGGTKITTGNGSSYTIPEISKATAELAVNSDEEAIFKNFMWLVHEKRFVLIIPVNAILADGADDAVFVTVVANGLSGLMDAKPCTASNSSCGKSTENGRWRKAGTYIKNRTTANFGNLPALANGLNLAAATQGNLTTFSDNPGDSVVLVEAWGLDLTGNDTEYGFSDTLYDSALWSLLFTKYETPNNFYGAIPPVISQNFSIFERLGFLTKEIVTPANSASYWDKRNKLLPMVAALAKTLKDQADATNGKNPYSILTGLAKVLVRPYIYNGTPSYGSTTTVGGYVAGTTIDQLRIKGQNSQGDGMRSPAMETNEYYPNSSYRSLLSILVENKLRYQDGLLNLLSQSTLASSTANFFNEFNTAARKEGRQKILSGLTKIVAEMKVSSENPTDSQFNVESSIQSMVNTVATYPDGKSNDIYSSDWQSVNDVIEFLRCLLNKNSVYSITKNVDVTLNILIDSQPTQEQAANLVELVDAMFTEANGSESLLVYNLLTVDTPKLLRATAPEARNTLLLLEGLTRPGGFLRYFHNTVSTGHSSADLLYDLERFLKAPMVQTTEKSTKNSLLYATGTLIDEFVKVLERGKKFSEPGNWFEDSTNVTEKIDTAYDAVNYLFSRK